MGKGREPKARESIASCPDYSTLLFCKEPKIVGPPNQLYSMIKLQYYLHHFEISIT